MSTRIMLATLPVSGMPTAYRGKKWPDVCRAAERGEGRGEVVLSPFSYPYLPFPGEASLVYHYPERMIVYTDTMERASQRRGTAKGVHTLESQPIEELSSLLAKVEVLQSLSKERALWLARRIPESRFERGQILFTPGQEASVAFLLLEGRVRLYKVLGAAELTIEVVEAGQLFGDVPALAELWRGTYAAALAPSRVGMLSLRTIRQLFREEPEVGLRWAQVLSRRLHEYQVRMADVALKKVSARLASQLERLLETEGVVTTEGTAISTRYTHEELATMIGSKRVAVSRAMSELREKKAVRVKGRRIYLEDAAALRRAAEVAQRES